MSVLTNLISRSLFGIPAALRVPANLLAWRRSFFGHRALLTLSELAEKQNYAALT
jgi:hypothetical protein